MNAESQIHGAAADYFSALPRNDKHYPTAEQLKVDFYDGKYWIINSCSGSLYSAWDNGDGYVIECVSLGENERYC